jgi:hypothetical protein
MAPFKAILESRENEGTEESRKKNRFDNGKIWKVDRNNST